MGYELVKILYQNNANVYLAGRTEKKCLDALETIKKAFPESKGAIEWLKLDLADLPTIKSSAETFLKKETRLDWLCNNAGVMRPPAGSKSPQVCIYDGFSFSQTTTIDTLCTGEYRDTICN